MAEHKIFVLEFEIKAPGIPKQVFELFTLTQAKLLGLRGWIEAKGEQIQCVLEGEKAKLEEIKMAIEQAERFKALIQEAVFAQLKEIEQFTCDNFEAHHDDAPELNPPKSCQEFEE